MDITKLQQLKELLLQTIAAINEILGHELNAHQELFCQYYAADRDCFGNGTKAYHQAYPDSSYEAARRSASDLLTNPDVLKRIRQLMDIFMNEEIADKELSFIMLQNAELNPKLGAIKHYNELKQRITKKLDLTTGGKPMRALVEFVGDDGTAPTSSS